ncbi:MAG: formate dehydrogenase accessory protein FdhE [Siculibacillus sp.]|nr:formate dehydrogenase accessory protein FdhE [Siculibacillus sp.]
MTDFGTTSSDPTDIGETSKPPFARLPDPRGLFARRAARFRTLAQGAELGPYLEFLGRLCDVQHAVQEGLAEAPAPSPELAARARAHAMPPVDRSAAARDESFMEIFDRLVARAREIDMPEAARAALGRVAGADRDGRFAMAEAVVANRIPVEATAEHVFAAAAVQVHFARLAASLDAAALVPVGEGACPACGGPPVSSMVVGWVGAHGTRFCACSTCQTLWNHVRVRCCLCGETKGISYREIEGGDGIVKAEVCDTCAAQVKIMKQHEDPDVDPIADDVATLALDLLVRDEGIRRGGVDPFLIGY